MEGLLTFNVSMSNGNIKCPIEKSIFALNLPLNLFRATVTNADTWSFKSFHTLFDTNLDHTLAKFEPNHMIGNVKISSFLTKNEGFLKPFLTKPWRHFARRFCTYNNCLMVNCWFLDYSLSVFQKLWWSDMWNLVKVAPNKYMADPTSMKHSISSNSGQARFPVFQEQNLCFP